MIAYMVPFFAVPSTEYPVPAPERIFTLSLVQRTYCVIVSWVDGADVTLDEEELGLDELEDEFDGFELCVLSLVSSSSGVGKLGGWEKSVSSSKELSPFNGSETE